MALSTMMVHQPQLLDLTPAARMCVEIAFLSADASAAAAFLCFSLIHSFDSAVRGSVFVRRNCLCSGRSTSTTYVTRNSNEPPPPTHFCTFGMGFKWSLTCRQSLKRPPETQAPYFQTKSLIYGLFKVTWAIPARSAASRSVHPLCQQNVKPTKPPKHPPETMMMMMAMPAQAQAPLSLTLRQQ